MRSLAFAAMGGTASVFVVGPAPLLDEAHRRIEDLESKWSRFRPDSEISRLAAERDRGHRVSADTRRLLRTAHQAWMETGGAFDPSVVDALVAWGYDRDLCQIATPAQPGATAPAPGLHGLLVDDEAGMATLGGAGFDPGGIGKGLAADILATELVQAGADSALVDLSGDLRVAGDPPSGWTVGVEDPAAPERHLLTMSMIGGGLATSTDRRRRWRTDCGEAHHLLDPTTGAPARNDLAGVTVLAGEAWWAEVLTKVVLIGGLDVASLARWSASGIARTRTGEIVATPDLRSLHEEAA